VVSAEEVQQAVREQHRDLRVRGPPRSLRLTRGCGHRDHDIAEDPVGQGRRRDSGRDRVAHGEREDVGGLVHASEGSVEIVDGPIVGEHDRQFGLRHRERGEHAVGPALHASRERRVVSLQVVATDCGGHGRVVGYPRAMFERILIANRGEVAARLARTLRRLGADTVALCAAGEESSVHVQACDTHVLLASSQHPDPYRDLGAVVRAAKESGCQAVHAGYGLFDRGPELARSLERAGIVHVGPAPDLVVLLRDRVGIRQAAAEAGLRVLAASSRPLGALADERWGDDVREEVAALGLPLVVKPAFGLAEPSSLEVLHDLDGVEAWILAHARNPDREPVVLERHVERPRHVEVYVVGDGVDHVVVGDVESSVRKDHRRVIAESPAPAIDCLHRGAAVRSAVWAAALDLAGEVRLRGVAAVHFLFDAEGHFHFVGMRPGLAPEHALVEMCASVDLVEVECLLALGESLPKSATSAEPTGHAVQARVEAALDPRDGRPFPGRTDDVRWPPAPTGRVRIESSVQPGSRVTVHDDPLVASVATYAPTRHEAVLALDRVVAETRIAPLTTNLRLLRRALNHESFRALTVDEGFLDRP
jgi:acetyl/propionyl-CoA carboxylase alpha subunit